jgi:hypothetical protein
MAAGKMKITDFPEIIVFWDGMSYQRLGRWRQHKPQKTVTVYMTVWCHMPDFCLTDGTSLDTES